MKGVDVLRIPIRSLPPEGVRLAGEMAPADLDIPVDDRTECLAPLHLRLHVHQVHGAVMAQGAVAVQLRRRCDRCLVYYTQDLGEVPVDHPYPGFAGEVLDLNEDVRDDILLAFPERSLCGPDCRGLCPVCGQNLNVRSCVCAGAPEEDSAWNVLDGLELPAEPGTEPPDGATPRR